MPKDLIRGYLADWSSYVLGPVPLPESIPPGISVQALGTFGLDLNDLRGTPAMRKDPIVKELGIPRHAHYYQAILDPPTGWNGWCLEVIGTKAEDPVPPDAFQWTDMFSVEHPMIIIAWRRRVYWTGVAHGHLEVRWHPDTGVTNHMVWPSTIPDKVAKTFLAKARQLLGAIDGRGRQPGPEGFDDAQELKDTLIRLIQTAHDRGLGTKEDTIALLLKPELDRRRGDIASVASVDTNVKSTVRWMQKYLPCMWAALKKEALQST